MAKCITTYNGTEKNGNVMVTIINYLANKGLLENQIAGIMGNIAVESDGYKTNLDKTDTNGKKSAGLCQWNDTRRTNLMESAKTNNKNWTDLTFQLDFMWSELTTNPSYKRDVLDWFKTHPNASVKECVKTWENGFEKCGRCNTPKREQRANEALEFYKEYANGECGSNITTSSSAEENKSNVDGEGNGGTNIGVGNNSGTETDKTDDKTPCKITVNITNQTNENEDVNNETENDSSDLNSTDYKGKTMTLRLEREDFSCDRTFGKLYDTTDGKKQFICYVVEDAVRYKGNKCYKTPYKDTIGSGDGKRQKVAIPYGTYSFTMGASSAAKKCSGKVNNNCRYFYAANYKKFPEYNGKIGRLSGVNKDGCSFDGILIHASSDNKRGDENNSAGCLIVGLNKQNGYLSGTHDAFYKLYENFIIPAAKAGSKMQIEIPRLYPDKDTKCCDKC